MSLWFVEKSAVNGLYLIALITLPPPLPHPLLEFMSLLSGFHSSLHFSLPCWVCRVCGQYSAEKRLRLPLLSAHVVRYSAVPPSQAIQSFCALPLLILNPANFFVLCIHDDGVRVTVIYPA